MRERSTEPSSASTAPSEMSTTSVGEAAERRDAGTPDGSLDHIPDMAWLKDAEGRFLAVNRRFEELCRRPRSEILGQTDLALWPPALAERYRADDHEVMRERTMKRIEEPLFDASGERTWLETIKVPLLDASGEVVGTAGVARDVTERKRAEDVLRSSHAELERLVRERTKELREANEALRADIAGRMEAERIQRRLVAILEATPDLVGIADVSGRVQYLNRAGRRLLGIAEDADPTRYLVPDFYSAEDAQRLRDVGMPSAARNGSWRTELSLRRLDGGQVPVSQLLLVHRGHAGEPEFFSTIVRDERERRALEADLLQAQKMEGIGRLAGGIAHDFNNLLTAILGYAELAAAKLEPGHPAASDLDEIRNAGERASELTRQLLAFARKQRIEPRVADLNELVRSTQGLLRRLIGEHIALVSQSSPEPALVTIDTVQFQQILVNLAVNARDAMADGGELRIELCRVELGRSAIAHPVLPPGGYVRVRVQDTGVGMEDSVLAHLFEPFFTTKETGEGTGLGLATCYGIVKQAGGHIEVRSRVGQGTCFEIHLPCAPDGALREPAVTVTTAALRGGSETILLVEDEHQVRAMAAGILEAHGYRLLVASSGIEALEVARAERGAIDLLLSDVVMPGASGPHVAELLRATRPALRVLFMSGYAQPVNGSDGSLPIGAALLAKPFTPELLARRVREELDRARVSGPRRASAPPSGAAREAPGGPG